MLSNDDLVEFQIKGYLKIKNAFSLDDAFEMELKIWEVLGEKFHTLRDRPSTWKIRMGYGFAELKRDKTMLKMGSAKVNEIIDQLLGKNNWVRPSNWGQLLVTFPEEIKQWSVPCEIWHTDFAFNPKCDPFGLMFFAFISNVEVQGGGTAIIKGSHRYVKEFVQRQDPLKLGKMKHVRLALMKSHPWFEDLCTLGDSNERIERFTKSENVAGHQLKVVELTGEPGDIVICDPWILHAVAPNCSDRVRMMCVQRIQCVNNY